MKTEYSAAISNKDVLDLVFVLDLAFIDVKTNIIFLGMENAFLCHYKWCSSLKELQHTDNLQSFPATLIQRNGCPNSIKDAFPKHVFDWAGLFQIIITH